MAEEYCWQSQDALKSKVNVKNAKQVESVPYLAWRRYVSAEFAHSSAGDLAEEC